MDNGYLWIAVAVISLVTAALRFAPFLLWGGKRKPPRLIERLGGMLQYAIMGMLVVYCLKDTHFAQLSGWLPGVIACGVVAATYLWKRNTLLSILGGTVCYMLLVQLVF